MCLPKVATSMNIHTLPVLAMLGVTKNGNYCFQQYCHFWQSLANTCRVLPVMTIFFSAKKGNYDTYLLIASLAMLGVA